MAVHLHGVQEALHEVAHIHAVMGDIGIQVFNHAVVGIGLQTGHVDEGAARHVHIGHVGGGQGFVYLVVAGIVYRLDGDEGMLGFKFLDDALKQIGVVVIVERVPEDHLGGLISSAAAMPAMPSSMIAASRRDNSFFILRSSFTLL